MLRTFCDIFSKSQKNPKVWLVSFSWDMNTSNSNSVCALFFGYVGCLLVNYGIYVSRPLDGCIVMDKDFRQFTPFGCYGIDAS